MSLTDFLDALIEDAGDTEADDNETDSRITSLPTLPTEIWERIIDSVAGLGWNNPIYSRSILSDCSLVCRAWLPRSRYHLFHHLSVRSARTVPRLVHALHACSHMSEYARSLDLMVAIDEVEPWISAATVLLPTMMKHLQSVTLDRVPLSTTHTKFFAAFSQFKSVSRLNLNQVVFNTFSQFTRLLLSLPNLTTLYLFKVVLKKRGTQSHLGGGKRLQQLRLTRLRYQGESDSPSNTTDASILCHLGPWLLRTPSITSLENIEAMHYRPQNTDEGIALSQFISACQTSLSTLRLDVSVSDDKHIYSLDLQHNTNLRYLCIRGIDDIPHLATWLLSINGTSPTIQEIHLQISVFNPEMLKDIPAALKPLDSTFRHTKFTSLKRVFCSLRDLTGREGWMWIEGKQFFPGLKDHVYPSVQERRTLTSLNKRCFCDW